MHQSPRHKYKLKIMPYLFTFIFLGLSTSHADISPENIPHTTKLNAEQFIELASTQPDLVIIDSRIAGDRKKGFIEGSFSRPNTETNCETIKQFVKSKSTPSLYYCNGIKCGRSVKAIKIALACGYNNIYWFRGGFEEWLEKSLPYIQK